MINTHKLFIVAIILTITLVGYYYFEFFIGDNNYSVLEIDDLLTKEECEDLIEYSKKTGMSNSVVLSNKIEDATYLDKNNRTSKTLWIKDSEHKVAKKVATLSQTLTGIPIGFQESLQVAHYEQGGKFNPHYDACNSGSKEYCDKINRYTGQRRTTLLIYLNDDFQGGETVFVKIGKTIKPKQGKGILFYNTTALNDEIIPASMHYAKPVLNGEKWICTKWSHSSNYPI